MRTKEEREEGGGRREEGGGRREEEGGRREEENKERGERRETYISNDLFAWNLFTRYFPLLLSRIK